eukprot:1124446-Pleurochrysis_carterae.AAC.4
MKNKVRHSFGGALATRLSSAPTIPAYVSKPKRLTADILKDICGIGIAHGRKREASCRQSKMYAWHTRCARAYVLGVNFSGSEKGGPALPGMWYPYKSKE